MQIVKLKSSLLDRTEPSVGTINDHNWIAQSDAPLDATPIA